MSKWKKLVIRKDILEQHGFYLDEEPLVIPASRVSLGNIKTLENAERLASCWNACLNLENPNEDIKKFISALKQVKSDTETYWDRTTLTISENTLIAIEQALALIKE